MILEVALLTIRPGQADQFEATFRDAQRIIAAAKGYVSHELRRCLEMPNQYLLLVQWRTLEDHTQGFRGSSDFQEWKRLLHHFYDPPATIQHYVGVTGA